MKRNILFICDFSSPHSRSLISYFAKHEDLKIHVISSFWAEKMDGVDLTLLNKERLDSKSSFVAQIASIVQNTSTKLYVKLSAYRLKKISQNLNLLLNNTKLNNTPDVIHILRTQPEGIASIEFLKKFKGRKYLTTWGQDFVLWANNNSWMKERTQELLSLIDIVYPDNHRDERIIKEDYHRATIRSFVMPATGGLQEDNLHQYDAIPLHDFANKITFFSNRGYPSSFVKLKELLQAYKIVLDSYPDSHFYIDLMSRVNTERDKTIEAWIKKLGLQSNVSVLHLSRDETFNYLRSCDYYVSATTSDGLPLSLLETLYFGIVPIVYNHESTSNLLSEFDHIYCYDVLHPENIAAAIKSAIRNNNSTRTSNTTANRKVIKQKYSQAINLQKTLGHYLRNE